MKNAYLGLAINIIGSLIVMYFAMFAMIDGWGDFHNNLNTFYMALMMAAPMGPLMLLTMGSMYEKRSLNLILHIAFVAIFLLAFLGIRQQALIDDRQFIASMIPHHSGAILMCREAGLTDSELISLCEEIEAAQRREIEQMEAIGARLGAG